jgi:predicted MFS family arabinose efflux permease
MFLALRIRDFRFLWLGGTISSLGSWLLVLAVPAHVFLVTNSLAATGLTLAAEYLPLFLLGPVAGVLTDRRDRRQLIFSADVFRALVVAAMLLALGTGRYWIFYLALAAESCGTALASPAVAARTPAIVGTGVALTSANSLNALSDGAVRLIGGPLGGVLFAAFGIKVLILADVASYLVAAIAIRLTSRDDRGELAVRGKTIRSVFNDMSAGFCALAREPVARALLPVSVLFLLANASLSAVIVAFGIDRLGGSRSTGLLFAALGFGFLVGAPVLRLTLDRFAARFLLFASLAATAAGYWLLFRSSSLIAALPAAVAVGLFGSMSLVVPETAVQRVVRNEVLGRISAVFVTGEAAATLVGAIVGPVLAGAIGLSGLALCASALTVATAVLAVVFVPRTGPSVADPGPVTKSAR